MPFKRLEHETIAEVLTSMDSEFLKRSKCFFGGGTAIVLKHDEYRLSLDVDFLCADIDGYRELRNAFFERSTRALFPESAKLLRDIKADAYGIRMLIEYKGQRIKFEIVREARIELDGSLDPELKVPTLTIEDMFAEKLLANSDRCMDRSVGYRDAIDLGCLVIGHGEIPTKSIAKAEKAYGSDIARKMTWVLNRLLDKGELRGAAEALQMDREVAEDAISALRTHGLMNWPDAGIEEEERSEPEGSYPPGF